MGNTDDIKIEISFDTEGFRKGMQELLKHQHYLRRMADDVYEKGEQLERMRREATAKFIDEEPEQNRMVIYIPKKLLG